jgi:small ligand-binding sensory domain FIST
MPPSDSPRAVSRLFTGSYDEAAARDLARTLRLELGAAPTLGIVFATPDYLPDFTDFLEILRLHAHLPLVAAATGQGIAGTGLEREGKPGFSLLLLHLPGAAVRPHRLTEQMVEEAAAAPAPAWHRATGVAPADVKGWLVLADPAAFPVERWARQWDAAYPGVPAFGGLASGAAGAEEAHVYLDGERVDGAVALAFTGAVAFRTVVSQGCKPIGEPYTITGADQNILYTLGSQPAYKILDGAFQALSDAEKEKARNNLFAGLAMSEYIEEFKRGDFLVRNILAADPNTGAVAIAARPRVGQTMQYQLRDAEAASADLHGLLAAAATATAKHAPVAALLCTCNGRGEGLFGESGHDARAIDRHFPGLPLAGFFANGEIGPVAGHTYVHGYTASVALLCPA